MLNALVSWMQLPALQAPPGRSGAAVCEIECRRLQELAALQIRVPEVIARSSNELLLSDLGSTLAYRLRKADDALAERLLVRSIEAIADCHRRGAYLGQPQARNIVVDDQQRIGFIDFEEDPGEVMTLAQAQCRDWLLFASGTVRHVPFADDRVSQALAAGLRSATPQVRSALSTSLDRLGLVKRICSLLGRRAHGMAAAIDALSAALQDDKVKGKLPQATA